MKLSQTSLCSPLLLLLSSVGLLASSLAASAEVIVGPFNFETGSAATNQYTSNFRETAFGAYLTPMDPSVAATNHYVVHDNLGAIGGTIAVYDPTPGTVDAETGFSGAFSVQFDVSAAQASSSFGIYFFDTTVTANNLLALVNLDANGTQETVRVFQDRALTDPTPGSQIGSTFTASSDLNISPDATPVFGTLQLTYTPVVGGGATVGVTLGTLSTSFNIAAADTIVNPGIALRINDISSSAGTAKIDNFQVSTIPETGVSVLSLGCGILCLLIQRRRPATYGK